MMTTKNVTLVLSGGGARGIAHIGVIEELERRGYCINSIAGTSMGALVGGVYAMGKLKDFKEWLYTIDKRKMFALLDFAFSSQGLIKGDRILTTLKQFISDTNIDALEIKFTATAFDVTLEKEVVFSSGSLYNAIRCSISIPTVFTPVIMENSMLVDGGVVNNIPIKNAVRSENDLLVAVNVNADVRTDVENPQPLRKGKRLGLFSRNDETGTIKTTYFDLIDRTIASTTNQLTQMIIEKYPPDILIDISRKSAGTFEFFKARDLVEIGRLAARAKLDLLARKSANSQPIPFG